MLGIVKDEELSFCSKYGQHFTLVSVTKRIMRKTDSTKY